MEGDGRKESPLPIPFSLNCWCGHWGWTLQFIAFLSPELWFK